MNNTLTERISKLYTSKNLMMAAALLGVYLISTGTSWAIFSFLSAGPTPATSGAIKETRSRINLNLPRTEACPINGAKFTKAERDIWEGRRPITAMIENHIDSRPPSGISKADVVYEAVAEGGITRFLTIFYCGAAAEDVKIAPVRSARIYFVNYAAEYGDKPIFMHVGGANDYSGSGDTARDVRALETLEAMGWRVPRGNDFDTTYDSGFPVFWRNYERLGHPVATEHTMMASLDAAYGEAAKRGLGPKDAKGVAWNQNFVSWKFGDDNPVKAAAATKISFQFWANKPDYDVEWDYDSANNRYLRVNAKTPYVDFESKEQVSAKNVVIIFAKERGPVDRNLHMFYTTIGTGQLLVFQNGTVIQGTWGKQAPNIRTKFMDKNGKEISLVRGTTWIEIIPAGNTVSY